MKHTIEMPVGIAIDFRNILAVLQDLPGVVERIEGELQAGPGLIDNCLDHLRPAVDAALGG